MKNSNSANGRGAAPGKLLSIQDVSCFGQCSLTVALPVVSACGVETAILPSAVLSTHTAPGFKNWTFRDLTDDMGAIEASWLENGVTFDAFYTGYVCASQINPILSIMDKCAAPGALRIVDPAMADNGVLYPGFADDFPAEMRRLCAGADCILPNLTEAALLLGRRPVLEGYDRKFVEDLLAALLGIGAKSVILTGVTFEASKLGVATFDGGEPRYYFNDRNPHSSHGTGDLYASVFAGAKMRGWGTPEAAALAADVVCEALAQTPLSHWYGVCFEKALPYLVKRLEGAVS